MQNAKISKKLTIYHSEHTKHADGNIILWDFLKIGKCGEASAEIMKSFAFQQQNDTKYTASYLSNKTAQQNRCNCSMK